MLALPEFGTGGLQTPSSTPSASGSGAGGDLVQRVSYDISMKVLRVRVAESVVDVAGVFFFFFFLSHKTPHAA